MSPAQQVELNRRLARLRLHSPIGEGPRQLALVVKGPARDEVPGQLRASSSVAPLRLLAQGLGLRLDEVDEHRDIAIADNSYRFDAGEIPAGTVASVRMRLDGIVDGQQRLHYSSIWSMPDEAVEDWQPQIAVGSPTRRLTRMTVDGSPPVQLDFALNGGELPGSTASAARVVNAIPAVCAANPGVLSALDLVVAAQAASS